MYDIKIKHASTIIETKLDLQPMQNISSELPKIRYRK